MIRRSHRAHRDDPGGSTPCPWTQSRLLEALAQSSCGLCARLSLTPAPTAGEMPPPWKSQNDFHRGLEISQRTRDSHIPPAAFRMKEENERKPKTKTITTRSLDTRPAVRAR